METKRVRVVRPIPVWTSLPGLVITLLREYPDISAGVVLDLMREKEAHYKGKGCIVVPFAFKESIRYCLKDDLEISTESFHL